MKLEEIAKSYRPLVNRILKESSGVKYSALFLEPNPEKAKANDFEVIRSVYLFGILERCHLASITSLARADRWLESLTTGGVYENVLGFAAALRGFLEATADAHDVMSVLPGSIHKLFPYLYLVFSGSSRVSKIMIAPKELEDRLIHYTYARKWPKNSTPYPHHVNKTNAEYIEKFEKFGVPGAKQLYSELCELTHPAAASVWCFLREFDDSIVLDCNQDGALVFDILTRFEKTIENLAQFSLNPALMSLCFMHRLFSGWPAPNDSEMLGIGSTKKRLEEIDSFIGRFESGDLDEVALRAAMT